MPEDYEKQFEWMVKLIQEENKKQTEIIQSSLKTEVEEIKSNVAEIKAVVVEESKKTKELCEKIKSIENKCVFFERALRRNNIIIFGLDGHAEHLIDYTIEQLNKLLELSLSVNSINNIRAIGNPTKKRPIVVEFVSFLTKLEILKRCRKLKGTRISISDDLTREDKELRKRLLVYQKEARQKNLHSYIKGNKLIINDKIYTIEDLEQGDNETEINEELPKETEKEEEPPKTINSASSTLVLLNKKITTRSTKGEEITAVEPTALKNRKITQLNLQRERPTTRKFTQDRFP